jgi:hypothetical protein
VPRSSRVCACSTCLGLGCREDEAHLLECPLYKDLLCKYHFDMFGVDNEDVESRFRQFMTPPDEQVPRFWGRMAGFLMHARVIRCLDLEE